MLFAYRFHNLYVLWQFHCAILHYVAASRKISCTVRSTFYFHYCQVAEISAIALMFLLFNFFLRIYQQSVESDEKIFLDLANVGDVQLWLKMSTLKLERCSENNVLIVESFNIEKKGFKPVQKIVSYRSETLPVSPKLKNIKVKRFKFFQKCSKSKQTFSISLKLNWETGHSHNTFMMVR
jgi:hypothetical protein